MWTAVINKTVTDDATGDEIMYIFSATGNSESGAVDLVLVYASMVEYGMSAQRWSPGEMAFPREQLYQFIQPNNLAILEGMYPDVVATAYSNAMAYVQSYIGAMFDIDAMLSSGDSSSTALTLRLALCISTVTFILASSPQNAETIELHNKQLHMLLKGLKSGHRNFGKNAIDGEPNVRVSIVKLAKIGMQP